LFRGHHDLEDEIFHVEAGDAVLEVGANPVLHTRVGLDDVPLAGLGTQGPTELRQRIRRLGLAVVGVGGRRLSVLLGAGRRRCLEVLDGRFLVGHVVCFFLLGAADHELPPKTSNIATPRPRSSSETYVIMMATNTSTTAVYVNSCWRVG